MNKMNVFYRIANHLIDSTIYQILGYNRMSPLFLINCEKRTNSVTNENKSLIDELMESGFVFATQKKRRTVEKRLVRRFGVEEYPDKSAMITPKHNITVCDNCGHYHELHTICGNCYKRVKEESDIIIDKIRQHFKYDEPIEEEVDLRYDNDTHLKSGPIVEMSRQRPEWFAQNLLSKSVGNKWIEKNPIVREDDPKVIKE